MIEKTFTFRNRSTQDAVIKAINFDTPGTLRHEADLSSFGSLLGDQLAFRGSKLPFSSTGNFVADNRPETATITGYTTTRASVEKTYVSHTGTTLNLNNTTGIEIGWRVYINVASGNYNGQTVTAIVGNSVVTSAPPTVTTPPLVFPVGSPIFFESPVVRHILTINRTDPAPRITIGWVATNNVFQGQTIINTLPATLPSTIIEMSSAPSSTPVIGSSITFRRPGGEVPQLRLSGIVGEILEGYQISGAGYTAGQTIVASLGPGLYQISSDADGTPILGGQLTFADTRDLATVAAGQSVTFSLQYETVSSTPSQFSPQLQITSQFPTGAPVITTLRSSVVVSNSPVPDNNLFFQPNGGAGLQKPATVTDPGSINGSAGKQIPVKQDITGSW
jgi:hypothetical protein